MNGRAITSLTNPTVKAVRALHQRKKREETGQFLVEGLRSILEAVDLGRAPRLLLHGPSVADHAGLRRAAKAAGDTIAVSEAVLAKISRRDNPQMVLGVFDQAHTALGALDPNRDGVLVALEAVRDPGNLGTIIRTADAAGCAGVIMIGETCDPYSVEAVRATMGSIFSVPIAAATAESFLIWRKTWPGQIIGTHLAAETDFRAAGYRRPCLILLGNEQAGLTPALTAACDVTVKIPMRGRADSLNLAVAAGVMLYAAVS